MALILAAASERAFLFCVAHIVHLLYRRLPIGWALAEISRSGLGAVLQDGILRYSRLAVCATNTGVALNLYERAAADGQFEEDSKRKQIESGGRRGCGPHLDTPTNRETAGRGARVCDPQQPCSLQRLGIERQRRENPALLRLSEPRCGARVCDPQRAAQENAGSSLR